MRSGLNFAIGAPVRARQSHIECVRTSLGSQALTMESQEVMSDQIAYKVLLVSELQQMQRDGVFRGSPADAADGYIHLSSATQVAATLDKHFSKVDGLVLAAVNLSRLGD